MPKLSVIAKQLEITEDEVIARVRRNELNVIDPKHFSGNAESMARAREFKGKKGSNAKKA